MFTKQARSGQTTRSTGTVASGNAIDLILSLHPDREWPTVEVAEPDRKAGKLLTDEECQILQYARLAGISPNAVDYDKSVTARGRNSSVFSECRGDMANVRFTARWRKGFDSVKFAAAAIYREDQAMRLHFPYMLDSNGAWRKGRVNADGERVYGRKRVTVGVLIDEWRKAETAKQDQIDADARRVREIELAELARLQAEDMIAQSRGRISKRDACATDTAMSQAFAEAGIA